MSGERRFWASRLRWRLRGAWQWPAFALFTLGDGLILHLLPPTRAGANLVAGVIVASFANLVLVGAAAPWAARRIVERRTRAPCRRFSSRCSRMASSKSPIAR